MLHSIFLLVKYYPHLHPPIPSIQFPYSIPSTCSIRAGARTFRPPFTPDLLPGASTKNLINCCFGFKPSPPFFVTATGSATVQLRIKVQNQVQTMLVQTIMRMISLQTARGGRPRFSHSRISRPAHSTLQVIAVCSQYIAMQQIVHCPHTALLLVFR